ncbi:uncharacterized protein BX663DRAFT_552074 [Cokeromyces recurvatus]|uniref:uncharacterized protein n=1 Tax=Cokeromyces recurvatus TaxID=90255 RepID=UPI00222125C5|nr:uncharacterized protein BX663DRAFT_552074 [Cokeromyces recurvatus]KAI7902667.1 hypothetical protein BX663DRAFT_552074 [Cokeromyces recurvatus]
MKYFTGDESGLIKWIAFPPKIKEEKRRTKRVKTDDDEKEDKKPEALQPLMGVFGKVDKTQAIQKLEWAILDNEKVLLVGRKNGLIQFISPESGKVLKEFQNKHVGTEEKQGYFVGLFVHDQHLCVCTSTGDLSYTPLDATNRETTTIMNLGPDLEIMRHHPILTHIFAIGGKERDLCIYDLTSILQNKTKEAIGPNKNTSSHKKNQNNPALGLVFQAKNVKNDFLDLRQPIWIHDLQFVNKEATQVALVTHYHQFRLYDTKAARRPIKNIEIGKQPFKRLSVGIDYNHVIFSDTMSNVIMLNIQTGKKTAQFKGFTGAVSDITTVPHPTMTDDEKKERFVATVSLDRFLRVHETSTVYRHLTDKAYLKQRLTCLLVDESYEYPLPKKNDEEEEEENAMWESMEMATDRKRKH